MDLLQCNYYPDFLPGSQDSINCENLFFHAFDQEYAAIWVLLAFGFGFVLAFAVGANDSANSWGTPVGAGTISLGVAYLLGSICETIGATFLSHKVISGVAGKTSVINMDLYQSNITEAIPNWYPNGTEYLQPEKELILGYVVAMISSQVWQLMATYLGWPVSGTHAIIFSEFGFTIVENGPDGVNVGSWDPLNASGVSKVVYGLIFSPLLGFLLSFLLYLPLYKFAITSDNPRGWGCKIAYSLCVFLMAMAMVFFFVDILATPPDGWDKHAFAAAVGAGAGLVVSLIFLFIGCPLLLNMRSEMQLSFDFLSRDQTDKDIQVDLHGLSYENKNLHNSSITPVITQESFVDESDEIKKVFRPLQLIAACYGSINHGANDVANCIGPVAIVWILYMTPIGYDTDNSSVYGIKLWGGFGISMGLLIFGSRVIMTMGSKISRLTPSYGFAVVLSASIVIMGCSCLGLPASTTHCQVMGIVGAGIAKGMVDTGSIKGGLKTVDMKLIGNIALSWIVTIPFAAALSATLYSIIRVPLLGKFSEV